MCPDTVLKVRARTAGVGSEWDPSLHFHFLLSCIARHIICCPGNLGGACHARRSSHPIPATAAVVAVAAARGFGRDNPVNVLALSFLVAMHY